MRKAYLILLKEVHNITDVEDLEDYQLKYLYNIVTKLKQLCYEK